MRDKRFSVNTRVSAETRLRIRPYPVHRVVDALQRLQPLGHQQVRELLVNRLHFLRHLQDPLFVRIRSVVVSRRAETEKNSSWYPRRQRTRSKDFELLVWLRAQTLDESPG